MSSAPIEVAICDILAFELAFPSDERTKRGSDFVRLAVQGEPEGQLHVGVPLLGDETGISWWRG